MNYIAEIKAFYDLVQVKQLSTGQIALWNALMNINNKCAWIKWFSVPSIVLRINTGLSESGIKKARNVLKQLGLIDFKINGTKPTSYHLISIANSSGDSTQDSSGVRSGDSTVVRSGVRSGDGVALNKLNETIYIRQNEILTKNDEKIDNSSLKANTEKKELLEHFELIWKRYPNKKGKSKALEFYLSWIKGRKISGMLKKLTDRQMFFAVIKYAKECEKAGIETRFIKHGDTFFNKAILDYVENSENE